MNLSVNFLPSLIITLTLAHTLYPVQTNHSDPAYNSEMETGNSEFGIWICSFNDWLSPDILKECNHEIENEPTSLCCSEDKIEKHLIKYHGLNKKNFTHEGLLINSRTYPLFYFAKEVDLAQYDALLAHELAQELEQQRFNENFSAMDLGEYEPMFDIEEIGSNNIPHHANEISHKMHERYVCRKHKKIYLTPNAFYSMKAHLESRHLLHTAVKQFKEYYCSCSPTIGYKNENEYKNHMRIMRYPN